LIVRDSRPLFSFDAGLIFEVDVEDNNLVVLLGICAASSLSICILAAQELSF
jgi:hypothetical protein